MSVAERKLREKEHLKNLILSGAKKLFLEKGIEKTTIRNIADEIDYSIGTVYVYFKDKDEIFNGLHSQGFQQLRALMLPLLRVNDPMERLKAIGHVYVDFALDNPDMYELMFSMKAPMAYLEKARMDEWNEGQATFEILRKTVGDCLEEGHFSGHQLNPLTYLIWGAVHGICSFNSNGRIMCVQEESPEQLVRNSYEELTRLMARL